MTRRTVLALAVPALSAICYAADAELAVVVNKSTGLATIGAGELRLLILGEKQKWPDGTKVTPVESAPESPERELMLKVVCKMSDAVRKRYYMQAAFTGKDTAPPRGVASAAALKQFVAATPGAIGCIIAADVDDSVKVLKVDGAGPGEPGYKLH
jgi:ABC-type phosphate transport system substrate-binding protein